MNLIINYNFNAENKTQSKPINQNKTNIIIDIALKIVCSGIEIDPVDPKLLLPENYPKLKKLFSAWCSTHNLSSVKELNLSKRQIIVIPNIIKNFFPHLKGLALGRNRIVKIDAIAKFSSLRRLYLNNNRIEEIPESIKTLSSLEMLSLRKNRIKKIPKTIACIFSLEFLDIRENPLTEQINVRWLQSLRIEVLS